MAAINSSTVKMQDSIMVSKLPSMLLAELKSLILGHFANFGRILRISCATKGRGERIAHIQFSSPAEALKAYENGKVLNGHGLVIVITDKKPSTQILASTPQPMKSTLTQSALHRENKGSLQSTLSAYFQQKSQASAAKEENAAAGSRRPPIPTATTILNEAISGVSAACTSDSSIRGHHNVDKKPNTCVKLEVYQTPSTNSNSHQSMTGSATSSAIPTVASSSNALVRLRPARSLQEILNLDTSRMKIVKTVSASDALACQYFTGPRHPFPLALMFGKMPGSVIMPIKSMMDSIKPGMVITDSTLSIVWNTILQSVLKNILPQTAKTVLQKSIMDQLTVEKYMQLENDVVSQELNSMAEREIGYEEDFSICCEDVADAILGLVCSSLIINASVEELRASIAVSRSLECCFRKLTTTVVKQVVDEIFPSEVLYSLCEEAVEDVLDSPIFGLHVRVVAAEALRNCREENNLLDNSSSLNSSNFGRRYVNAPSRLTEIMRHELTEHWLQTSGFNIHRESRPRSTESESLFDTDISCSVGSSNSSWDNHSVMHSTAIGDMLPSRSPPSVNPSTTDGVLPKRSPPSATPLDDNEIQGVFGPPAIIPSAGDGRLPNISSAIPGDHHSLMSKSSKDENSRFPGNGQDGFFFSLKRKAASIFSFKNPFKRRRLQEEHLTDDDGTG